VIHLETVHKPKAAMLHGSWVTSSMSCQLCSMTGITLSMNVLLQEGIWGALED